MERSLTLLREEAIAMVEMGIRTMTQEAVIKGLEKFYIHSS